MSRESRANATKSARVREIPVEKIEQNPHNPRRLFDEEPMRILKESIAKLGILVPVAVYEKATDVREDKDEKFVLLDGERRWRCARELQLETIPAIVVEEPTETRNILTMFHIHNVREGWQLMPTALKLQTLMKQLRTRTERKLAELTKLSISQIRRCKILLSYPKRFQNMMLAPPDKRLKADFFIELDRIRRPARTHKFPPWNQRGDSKCIDILLGKYRSGVIRAVTEFRKLAEIYRASISKGRLDEFMVEFDRFLSEPDVAISEILVEGATFAKEAKEIRRSTKRLYSQIESLDFEVIASDEETVHALKQLVVLIETKLKDALLIEAREEIVEHA